jgi:RNA polymerase sigma-70 factor (ECF subfamily)
MARIDDDFEVLFRAEYARVAAAVGLVIGSGAQAEEVAQDAFCRALERWDRVRVHASPGAWVQLTALRMAVRSSRRRVRGESLAPAWGAATVAEPVDVDLLAAVDALPGGQRTAVVLHHLLDLPVAEVADVMGVRPGTVKTHLHRARTRLAEVLGEPVEVDDGTR